jgi:hypothetical protein
VEESVPPLFEKRLALQSVARRAATGEPLRRAILVLASLLVTLMAAETILGIIPAGKVVNVYNRRMTVGLDCYPTNPRGYFTLNLRDPATRERFEALRLQRIEQCTSYAPYAVELKYNSVQFRDREPGPRNPGVLRIAVLGDSFTAGQGVVERDTYPRVLERTLNASGADWELLTYDPDIVIYGMVLNDCEQSTAFRARHAFVTAHIDAHEQRFAPWAGPPPFGLRTALFVQYWLERHRLDGAMRTWYRELYAEPNHEGWERSKAYIEEMQDRMRRRGGYFLVATWPMLPYLGGDYPLQDVHKTVGQFCLAAGIPWLDLLPALKGRSAGDLWVHALDPHPNAIAHRLVAKELIPVVRRLVERDSRPDP